MSAAGFCRYKTVFPIGKTRGVTAILTVTWGKMAASVFLAGFPQQGAVEGCFLIWWVRSRLGATARFNLEWVKGAELGGTGLFFPTWGNRSRTWGKCIFPIF
jgi:hypothetical protein